MNNENKSKDRKTIIMIAAAAVLLVVLAVGVTLLLTRASRQEAPPVVSQDTGARGVVAIPENIDELREKASQPVQDGYYEVRMNVDWVFKTAQTPSDNAYVENSPNNTRTVYFDLILPDTNELIYSSPFIPVGAKFENFALDAALPAGEYTPTLVYHLVDDDNQEITTVSVSVTLRILR